MMKKIVLSFAMLSLASISASIFANDYQVEVGGLYSQIDVKDGSYSADFDGLAIMAEFFFKPVDTSKGPFAQASFLDKSSSVSLAHQSIRPDVGSDFKAYMIDGRYVSANDLILEASYTDEEDDSSLALGVGAYISPHHAYVFQYESTDETDVNVFSLEWSGFAPLPGMASLAFIADLAFIDTRWDNGYGVSGELHYYFTPRIGLGVNFALGSIGDADTRDFSVLFDYFVTPAVRLSAIYEQSKLEVLNITSDLDAISIGVSGRF